MWGKIGEKWAKKSHYQSKKENLDLRDQEAAGSNPVTPTKKTSRVFYPLLVFLLGSIGLRKCGEAFSSFVYKSGGLVAEKNFQLSFRIA